MVTVERITIWVTAGARKNSLEPFHGFPIRIRVAAPPQEGRANDALVQFLAEILSIPQRSISIVHGRKARLKHVVVKNLTKISLLSRLGFPGDEGKDASI
jgi:uncharacterized protein (TIGR00251 family)